MAKIKSFTDLSQSKTLSKLLPIESADMEYVFFKGDNVAIGNAPFVKDDSEVEDSAYSYTYDRIACWSLTALLGVIKKYGLIDLRFLSSTFDSKGEHLTNVWCCTFDNINTVSFDFYADNPVDACVAMIEKLHKLNLL